MDTLWRLAQQAKGKMKGLGLVETVPLAAGLLRGGTGKGGDSPGKSAGSMAGNKGGAESTDSKGDSKGMDRGAKGTSVPEPEKGDGKGKENKGKGSVPEPAGPPPHTSVPEPPGPPPSPKNGPKSACKGDDRGLLPKVKGSPPKGKGMGAACKPKAKPMPTPAEGSTIPPTTGMWVHAWMWFPTGPNPQSVPAWLPGDVASGEPPEPPMSWGKGAGKPAAVEEMEASWQHCYFPFSFSRKK